MNTNGRKYQAASFHNLEGNTMTPSRIKFICSECCGDNVKRDAWASWDFDKQEWVLAQTFEEGFCDDCEDLVTLEVIDEITP